MKQEQGRTHSAKPQRRGGLAACAIRRRNASAAVPNRTRVLAQQSQSPSSLVPRLLISLEKERKKANLIPALPVSISDLSFLSFPFCPSSSSSFSHSPSPLTMNTHAFRAAFRASARIPRSAAPRQGMLSLRQTARSYASTSTTSHAAAPHAAHHQSSDAAWVVCLSSLSVLLLFRS